MSTKEKEYTYKEFLESEETKAAAAQRKQAEASKPSSFSYGTYTQSDAVKQAQDKLNQHTQNKPGAYTSQWQTSLNDTLNKILNREKFTYDLNGDALYQQYKNQYTTQGVQAMMDTMGQAQSMTGGYGNSYAQTAGQQAYHGYLQQLNDKVPELYQLALNQYNREGDDLYTQYGLFADREGLDYGRYRDQLTDYNAELGRLTDDSRYQSETDYNRYMDQYNQGLDQFNMSYAQYRDQMSDAQWQQNFDYQKQMDALAQQNWQAEFDEAIRQYNLAHGIATGTAAGGIGGSTGGIGTGSTNNALVAQRYLNQNGANLAEDGVWGSKSAAAAKAMGYNSLDEVLSELGISDIPYQTGGYADVEAEVREMVVSGDNRYQIIRYLEGEKQLGAISDDEYVKLASAYASVGT